MWRPVEGFKPHYRVNEEGCVESKARGEWKPLKQHINGGRVCVNMRTESGSHKHISVAKIVYETFVRKLEPGEVVFHKDRVKWNCKVWNLVAIDQGDIAGIVRGARKSIAKIDRNGEVVWIYGSFKEACQKEYISTYAMWLRLTNKVKNPFKLTGYTYQYEDRECGRRKVNFVKR